ncbi:MAG: acyltransferase family protein, partial [Methanomicrobiaceae archaeon]|nr:acyltransferase family protein [Methanomicrobiaceae archaeon]
GLLSVLYGNGAALHDALAAYILVHNQPLWFLAALFCGLIVLYSIAAVADAHGEAIGLCCTAALILAGYLAGRIVFLPWGFDIALLALGFLYPGYLARKHGVLERPPGMLALFLAAAAFAAAVLYNGPVDMNCRQYGSLPLFFAGALAGIFLVIAVLQWVEGCGVPTRVLSFFGINSLIIFAFHGFASGYAMGLLRILQPDVHLLIAGSWILSSTFSILLSLAVTLVLMRTPWIRGIFSAPAAA